MPLKEKREIWWTPAYDKTDPNPSKNDGVHGVDITFVVRNEERTAGLTFSLMTNWHLPHVVDRWKKSGSGDLLRPLPSAVSIHKLALTDAKHTQESCSVVGGPCEADGSFSLGESFFQTLVAEGIEALWLRMEQQLKDWS